MTQVRPASRDAADDHGNICSPIELRRGEEISLAGAFSILNIVRRNRAWAGAFKEGLTPLQGELLQHLLKSDAPIRLGGLAALCQLKTATITTAAASLEEKGLILKVRDRRDGRAILAKLTSRGRAAARRASNWTSFLEEAAAKMSEGERTALLTGLKGLLSKMDLPESSEGTADD